MEGSMGEVVDYRGPAKGSAGGVQPMALRIGPAVAASGLSRSAIYREAAKGNIVLLKLGRTTLVDMATVRTFLANLPRASVRSTAPAA
jgi:hypothetical protein